MGLVIFKVSSTNGKSHTRCNIRVIRHTSRAMKNGAMWKGFPNRERFLKEPKKSPNAKHVTFTILQPLEPEKYHHKQLGLPKCYIINSHFLISRLTYNE